MPYTATLQLKAKAQPNIKVKAQGLGEMISVRVSLGSTTFLNRGSLSFSPLSLFTLGSQGAWYDPTDVANLDWRRNLFLYSDAFSSTGGVGLGAVNNGDGSVTFSASGQSAFKTIAPTSISAGEVVTLSVTLSGTGTINLGILSGGGSVVNPIPVTLTSTPTRYTNTITNPSTGVNCGLGINSTSAGTCVIAQMQLELGSVATTYQPITNLNAEVIARFPNATLYQDNLGVTPVTASGNTVGLLLDKSEGLVLGPELVVNGTFDAGISGWTNNSTGTGSISYDGAGNTLQINTTDASNRGEAQQAITTTANTSYVLSVDVAATVDTNVQVWSGSNQTGTLLLNGNGTTTGSRSFTFSSQGFTTCYVVFQGNGATANTVNVDNVSVKELPGYHATQPTLAARPIYRVAANGDKVLENDGIDDALNVTFPNLGTNCTVCYVTQSEVRLDEAVTLNGSYTLPNVDILGFVAIDRALTKLEKIQLIYYMASKAQGVTYGAGIDDLDLIALNAVDLFVYDTSKDSDGGAWRTGALAQASSWFNETLNTATRGSRREFPAVAVIVAEATKVTIYDGDDPDLPMWMVFSRASDSYFASTSQTVTSVGVLRGILVLGMSSTGLREIDFMRDVATIRTSTTYSAFQDPIASRNAGTTFSGSLGTNYLINNTVNDVAMTVLPGAPINPATGLPVPTIAVGTNGGVSIIRDNGTVVDWMTNVGTSSNVMFTEWGGIQTSGGGGIAYGSWGRNTIPASDTNTFDYLIGSSWSSTQIPRQGSGGNSTLLPMIDTEYGTANAENAGSSTTNKLMLINANQSAYGESLVSYITSSYNTGWMNGNIKGAFLSDTSATALVGSGELITNGTFNTNTTGWTPSGNATLSVVSNRLRITNASATNASARQDFSTVAGNRYVVSLEQTQVASRILVGTTSEAWSLVSNFGTGTNTFTFVAPASTTRIVLQTAGSVVGEFSDFDNVSVKLADADRSVNNKGLIVNGTVTRTPVATGADLVAYSGFSASNYLEQPYNSALDFGTGDFCVMGWVNLSSGSVSARNQTFFDRYSGTAGMFVRADFNTGVINFSISDGSSISVKGTQNIGGLGWVHFAAVRSGGVALVYQNGLLVGSGANAKNMNASVPSWVGNAQSVTSNYTQGSLALLRISATAPTAEQIAKIYNDEKVLFEPNAQATLYGASDAVTALAHDPDTGMLHVGTSSGRSVFRGLERVSHRAKSVSTSISAVGGLVIDK